MSHRLTPARGGEAPTLSIRTTPEIIAGVDEALTTLRAALPAGVRPESVTRGDAARLLLAEAIAARAARPAAPPVDEAPAAPARRVARSPAPAAAVVAGGQSRVHPGDADYDRVRAALLAARAAAPREWTGARIVERSRASAPEVGRLSQGRPCSRLTVDRLAKILPT